VLIHSKKGALRKGLVIANERNPCAPKFPTVIRSEDLLAFSLQAITPGSYNGLLFKLGMLTPREARVIAFQKDEKSTNP
jgi:hypothetical protein